jgi:hypothetical protein
MATERRSGPWYEPTWRRLIGSTVVLFLVILAFLVGRVRSGADPALAGSTTRPAQQAPALNGGPSGNGFDPQNQGVDPSQGQVDPNDPFADPQGQGVDPSQVDPSAGGGSDDNFGNAIPDGSSGSGSADGSGQGVEPPSTHVS